MTTSPPPPPPPPPNEEEVPTIATPPSSSLPPPSALRRQQERDVILSFDAHPLGRHDAYFFIATTWFTTWTTYVCDATATSARPGPLDAASLLLDPLTYRVQPHLRPTVDYRGVTPQVYALFVELYGTNETVHPVVRYTLDLYAPPVMLDDVRAMLRIPTVRARAVVTKEVTAPWPTDDDDDETLLAKGLRPRDRDDETWAYKCCCRCAYLVPCVHWGLGGGPTYALEEATATTRWTDYVCGRRANAKKDEGTRGAKGTEDESSGEERDDETRGLLA